MRTWQRKYEWVQLAACEGSDLHTKDDPSESEVRAAAAVCAGCKVRPECIEWALRERACGVVVAGEYLPDPMYKRELRAVYAKLRRAFPDEFEARGGEV
jgi:coenzyme F420-reducing hydrogenase delta subunit